MSNAMPADRKYFPRLLNAVVNPDQFDFWARQFGSVAAWQRCFARVAAVKKEEGGVVVTLRPNRHFREFGDTGRCAVSVEIDGRKRSEAYAAEIKPDRRELDIRVVANTNNAVSRYLRNTLKVGDVVELSEGAATASELCHGEQENAADDTAVVILRASDRRVRIPRNISILEALEAEGITPKFGCRRGVCNRCSCIRLGGTTADIASGSESDVSGQPVRICVSHAVGDIELDL
ncbi:iron-sulfur cluster-binding domain-containing protein [Spongiibacter sp. KMU-166]|uniref:Iron-sulfur cluster-binding domain-containing protein n=1 Tax=Spongiibacter thalassae TaxID=2721624 RepID=A0ABX1GKM9_9GAMM|nr:iron-sulfur cluster-binding domain-containing protein [Spongiibacter thalassae]NKI19471.1 iron-sulfur cluster-binding domain-containing protein [Spongiibacter thalassae]